MKSWKTVHTVMVACLTLAAGLPRFADSLPPQAHGWVLGAASGLTLLGAVLGAVSESATTTPPPPPQAQP